MSKEELEILERLRTAIPKLSDAQRQYLLGYGECLCTIAEKKESA